MYTRWSEEPSFAATMRERRIDCRRRERPEVRSWLGGPSRSSASRLVLREWFCVSEVDGGGLRILRRGCRSKGIGASLFARVLPGKDWCADGVVLSCSFEALTAKPFRCCEIKDGCVEGRCECDFMARNDRFSGDSGSGIRAGSMGRARREDAMIAKWQQRGQERKDISVFSECFSC